MKGGRLNAVQLVRFGQAVQRSRIPFVPRLVELLLFLLFSSNIPLSVAIGSGTYCSHRGMAVVIHRDAEIGRDCTIGTSVVLGGHKSDKPGAPKIGNGVYIATGAKILGPVTVGDGAKIGANAVVIQDVPAHATAVGVPARIILAPPDNQRPVPGERPV